MWISFLLSPFPPRRTVFQQQERYQHGFVLSLLSACLSPCFPTQGWGLEYLISRSPGARPLSPTLTGCRKKKGLCAKPFIRGLYFPFLFTPKTNSWVCLLEVRLLEPFICPWHFSDNEFFSKWYQPLTFHDLDISKVWLDFWRTVKQWILTADPQISSPL